MRTSLRLTLTAGLVLTAFSSPLLANDDAEWSTDRVDDAWAERALANPDMDRGWCSHSNDGKPTHHEVREFSYPRGAKPIAIDGGVNGGMTVMGGERDGVRILYRITARASTEDRARALTPQVQLELKDGWLRPSGPETSRGESWSVEIKAWVPRASNLVLKTYNGPLGLRGVRGTMDLNSTNGPVSLEELGGAVQAHTENGPLHVGLSGSHWGGTGLDAEAVNGPVNLEIPAGYSARLITGSINGPQAYDDAIEPRRSGTWSRTTLGKGGPVVRVVTTNGPFQIGYR